MAARVEDPARIEMELADPETCRRFDKQQQLTIDRRERNEWNLRENLSRLQHEFLDAYEIRIIESDVADHRTLNSTYEEILLQNIKIPQHIQLQIEAINNLLSTTNPIYNIERLSFAEFRASYKTILPMKINAADISVVFAPRDIYFGVKSRWYATSGYHICTPLFGYSAPGFDHEGNTIVRGYKVFGEKLPHTIDLEKPLVLDDASRLLEMQFDDYDWYRVADHRTLRDWYMEMHSLQLDNRFGQILKGGGSGRRPRRRPLRRAGQKKSGRATRATRATRSTRRIRSSKEARPLLHKYLSYTY